MLKALLIAALGGVVLFSPALAATISGQVLDERQHPLRGARIDLSAVPVAATAFTPFQAARLSGPAGGFTFTVPAGTYRICVSVRHSRFLNPCTWSKTPPTVTLAENQTVAVRPVVLMRGYPLTIRLNDAGGLLAREAGKRSTNAVLVGFTPPNGMFQPITAAHSTPAALEHVLIVPRDMPVRVSLMNRGFKLADAAGKALAATNQPYSFTAVISGERHPRLFTFSITGMQASILP